MIDELSQLARLETLEDVKLDPDNPLEFIRAALAAFGVEISFRMRDDKLICDFNTQAKSHLHMIIEEGKAPRFSARYNREPMIKDLGDLLYEVKYCMHGRPYVGVNWLDALTEYGIIEVRETVKNEIIF